MLFLGKNIKHLRQQTKGKKLSQEGLAKKVGSTRNAISSYEDGRAEPKLEILQKLAAHFKVSVGQLIGTDLMKMTEDEIQRQQDIGAYTSGENLRLLTITLDDDGNENIELVPEKAAAGYTKGYADKTYLADLPKYQLPFLSKGKTYRAFEISGESMLPLQPKSIVIGAYLNDWTQEVKDGDICVVLSEDGIVLKKVYNRINERGALLLKSTNIAFEPYEMQAADILEIWKFSAYISTDFPDNSQHSLDEIKDAFWRLEDQVREIKEKTENN